MNLFLIPLRLFFSSLAETGQQILSQILAFTAKIRYQIKILVAKGMVVLIGFLPFSVSGGGDLIQFLNLNDLILLIGENKFLLLLLFAIDG